MKKLITIILILFSSALAGQTRIEPKDGTVFFQIKKPFVFSVDTDSTRVYLKDENVFYYCFTHRKINPASGTQVAQLRKALRKFTVDVDEADKKKRKPIQKL